MGPELLAELAQIEIVTASSRPTRRSWPRSTGSICTPATTGRSRARSTWAAPAGSSSRATSSGRRCAGWSTSRERRAAIDASLRDVYETLFLTASPTCTKAALNLLGHRVGGLRLPLVEASEDELEVVRAMLVRHDLLAIPARSPARLRRARGRSILSRRDHVSQPGAARVSAALRVLPLGGLGEIGKNMTVVEYDGRIVVVDVGLRFPTPEMVGIDLVLPDFTYLRERAADIEAIVVTHGHEDHLGALPWVLRELAGRREPPPVYGGPLTMAMARSKLDEHKLRDVELNDLAPGETLELGPFALELIHMTHSIPDSSAVALGTELGTVLITGDYKFDQTPVDGAAGGRLAPGGARPRGGAAAVRRLDQRRPRGLLALGVGRRAAPARRSSRAAEGRIVVTSFASNIHRVQQVVDAAHALGRKVALVGRSMRKNVGIGRYARPHRGARGTARRDARDRGLPRRADRDPLDGLPGRAALGAAADGLPRPPPGAAARRRHGRLLGDARCPATSARSTRRSIGSTTSAATW